MKRNEIIHEHKKGVRAVKYNAKPKTHIEPPKPTNPVAKNASAAIGGGAAGAHKDAKKASQSVRGQKHKAAPEMAEGYNPNSASAEHRRSLDDHTRQTLKAKAEAPDATDRDKERYQNYLDRKEQMRRAYDDRMEREDIEQEALYRRRGSSSAYDRDYQSSISGMGKRQSQAYQDDGGANDERHDLDPSDWYIVKDGKMYKTSVYPRQEQEAIARGYSRTRDEAKAKAEQQGVAEGSEFGAYYYEKVAQEIFNKREDISSEDEVLNQAYKIVANDQGQKSARYMFNYDEDFPSDLVSAYFYLQKQKQDANNRSTDEAMGAEVGKITKVDPATKKATLTKADGSSMEVDSTALKPTADGKMSMDTPDTDELKAGTAVVSTENSVLNELDPPPNDSTSPIHGGRANSDHGEHNEIISLLRRMLSRR